MAFDDLDLKRYARQLALPEWSGAAQRRLGASTVAILGLGGVGAPASLYLAGAGVGRLILIDDDVVAISNLHRQPLYATDDAGEAKTAAAMRRLEALNPKVALEARPLRLDRANAAAAIAGADLVLDGSDNFPTRDAAHQASYDAGIPLVSGSAQGFDGQLTLYRAHDGPPHPCLRCAFPDAPPADLLPTCAQGGVLGPVVGVIGGLAALEAMKALVGSDGGDWGDLSGTLLMFDGRDFAFRNMKLARRADCRTCGAP